MDDVEFTDALKNRVTDGSSEILCFRGRAFIGAPCRLSRAIGVVQVVGGAAGGFVSFVVSRGSSGGIRGSSRRKVDDAPDRDVVP
jgi:hypothetical protein